MEKIRQLLQNRWVFLVIVALGLDLRIGAAMLGYNFDMDSWYIVADIMRHGGNVYVETVRYNYGPGWFLILHVIDMLSGYNHEVLRYLIAAFLSFVDLGICLILCRKAGRLAGALFFLNPASILISGYHCQFDNLAILIALWSVLLYGEDFAGRVNQRKLCGLLVLGLSLIFKHVFFMFPLWLAVKQKGLWQKMVVLFVPCACFLASFAPYWAVAHREIIQHVFCYETIPGGFIYRYFIPQCIQFCWDSRTVWYGLLVLFAFICRARNGFESLLIYTAVLVVFSPYLNNSYLVIVMALAAVYPNALFLIYMAASAFCIFADYRNGPRIWAGLETRHDDLATYLLFFSLCWLLWRAKFLQIFQGVRQEIRIQLGLAE